MSEEDEQPTTSKTSPLLEQQEEKENVEKNEEEKENTREKSGEDEVTKGKTIERSNPDDTTAENDETNYERKDAVEEMNRDSIVENEPKIVDDTNSCRVNQETGEVRPKCEKKHRKKSKGKGGHEGHRVTMTVTIAAAIPTNEEDGPKVEDMVRKKKRLLEAPKAQNYYHCSYYLLPEDTDPIKTDVVTFGMAAKIYTDHDSKVIKTWQEGHQTWVAWSHSQKLHITKDLLLKLFDHTLQLRIWESREKVSARARFDRPKVFRLPQAKPGEDYEDVGGVRSLVMKQSQSYIALQPKKSLIDRPLPQNLPPELKEIKYYNKKDSKGRQVVEKTSKDSVQTSDPIKLDCSRTPEHKSTTQVHKGRSPEPVGQVTKQVSPESMKSYKKLGQLAGTVPPDELKQIKRELKQQNEDEEKRKEEELKVVTKTGGSAKLRLGEDSGRSTSTPSGRRGLKDSPQQREARRKSRKSEQAAAALQAYIKQHGNIRIPVKLKLLFSGLRSITNRLDRPVPAIEDVFITVSLDGPLMSESLRQELNPLVIKLASATNLPNTPLSYDHLEENCLPLYCMYKFMGELPHITSGKEHGKNAYWEDTNVVLLGTQERAKLREYLNGPPLQIEVHDRDRKIKEAKLKPTLFGEDMEDDKISNVGMVTGKRTLHNPFKERSRPWDPYGVAKFDLSQLLLGERTLYMTSPIHCCPIPDVMGRGGVNSKLIGVPNAVDGPKDEPLSVGHYLDVNSQLKVRIEIAYPLTTLQEVKEKPVLPTPKECPFARLVYVFDYKNTCFLQSLEMLITVINAKALGLEDMPEHVVKAALSTYKLSYDQQTSTKLDIVTGFQILDGEQHIFILEGLRDKAINKLWDTLPRQKTKENTLFDALYNSDLMFSERMYAALDVDLCRIRLHEPLSIIVQQPLLYIRDMVPRLCLEAIIRLDKLLACSKLRELTKNDLFPSAKMIVSLSREFGIPLTTTDFEELKFRGKKVEMLAESKRSQTMPVLTVKRREWTPLDNYNDQYLDMISTRDQSGQMHNFIQKNIDVVGEASIVNSMNRVKPDTIHVIHPNGIAHNYSTQALNSTELAKESLRQQLAKDPNDRFTYCPDYNSASVVPIDVTAFHKQEFERSKTKYQSSNGFVYPGVKSALLSNEHPRKPDHARVTENMQPWTENILHANILKPTLDRERFTWSLRDDDVDLWQKPPKDFGINPPATIHLAGETLEKEKRMAQDVEDVMWRDRLIVEDSDMKFHRCATETELTYKGFLSSNQIDRLHGLLKDKPKKYSLLGSGANTIPALSVVNYPSVDTYARDTGLPILPAIVDDDKAKYCGDMPGAYENRSWHVTENSIPIRDMEHSKFEELKGHDFKLYHKERSAIFKSPIKMLSKEDRNTNLFRTLPPEALRVKSQLFGNECFRHPPPGIRPATINTEFYYPDREQYWKSPCQRDPSNKPVLKA